jgi:predicted PurR-regulated permease PerM
MAHTRQDWITLCAITLLWLLALLMHTASALLAGMAGFLLCRALLAHRHLARLPAVRWWVGLLLGIAPFLAGQLVSALLGRHMSELANDTIGLWHKLLEQAVALRSNLPDGLQPALPDDPAELQRRLLEMLHTRSDQLVEAGRHGVGILVHTLFGWWLGIAAACSHSVDQPGSLLRAWHRRWQGLATVFGRVARGQCWVALVNTAFTTLFLLVVAPLAGWHFPYRSALILITLSASLVPVAGNLVCNSILLLVGLGVSLPAGVAALVFMVVVHKLEYLVSARILGSANRVAAWELIAAMLGAELLFGPVGLICATVLYPYFKQELRSAGLV